MRYRIVEDAYSGYEVQAWRWYFPFWIQPGSHGLRTNTFRTIEKAKCFIEELKNRDWVKYEE